MSIKLTVGAVRDALFGMDPETPIVLAEVSEPGRPDVISPIDAVEEIDANLNYSWDGDKLDESGCLGEPVVVVWWKDHGLTHITPTRPVQHRLVTWDYREQPDLTEISAATTELSRTGTVYCYPVDDTGCDQYAAIITNTPLDAAGVQSVFEELWRKRMDDDNDQPEAGQ